MKKSVYCLFVLWLFAAAGTTDAQEKYHTNINGKQIKTLQVKVAGNMTSVPCIPLGGNEQIEINFDGMGNGYLGYVYKIIHCNGDWTPSGLSPIEYMDGLQGMTIDDFGNSFETSRIYSNYRLFLPNQDIQFKISGNYALQVYREDDPGNIMFTACFSIVEPLVDIQASVSGNTEIDTNLHHQQVNLDIDMRELSPVNPETELNVFVYQNNRPDNAAHVSEPTSIRGNRISYTNNPALIFPAGNEYRRMDFLSSHYNGLHVQETSVHKYQHHAILMPDYKRSNQVYQYDHDQNGRFIIRCDNCMDADTEADYFIVHFTLISDSLPGGDVHLNGGFLCNALNKKSKMDYNAEKGQYEKSILLKQGNYDYQYLFVPTNGTTGETAPLEGDYFQTQNEYIIYVYHRPEGARYDRLVGVKKIKNAIPLF